MLDKDLKNPFGLLLYAQAEVLVRLKNPAISEAELPEAILAEEQRLHQAFTDRANEGKKPGSFAWAG